MTRCEWCGRRIRSSKAFTFSTDDTTGMTGVPGGPLEVHFCSSEHMDEWEAEHVDRFPGSSRWPMEWPELPLPVRMLRGTIYAVVIGFAIYGAISLALKLS
jgi:hypothetical protein